MSGWGYTEVRRVGGVGGVTQRLGGWVGGSLGSLSAILMM